MDLAVTLQIREYELPPQQRHSSDYPKTNEAVPRSPVGLFIYDVSIVAWRGTAIAWEWLGTHNPAIISAFTIGLFIGTAILARYTYGLWDATIRVARETKEASRYELRPYIGLEELFFTVAGKRLSNEEIDVRLIASRTRLNVGIKNFGRTPGYEVTIRAKMIASTTISPLYRPMFSTPIFRGQVIYPDHRDRVPIDQTLPHGPPFFVYGTIVYLDPISNMWWTFEFCRQYTGGGEFVPYGAHNNETGISAGTST